MAYTIADLERITDVPRRALRLWADAGVIKAEESTEHAGTGKHRRFPRKEAIIACLVKAFADKQMPIGVLIDAAKYLRGLSEQRDEYGPIWDRIELIHTEENPPTFIIFTRGRPGRWSAQTLVVGDDEAEFDAEIAKMFKDHAEILVNEPEAMFFMFYANNYLRRPA